MPDAEPPAPPRRTVASVLSDPRGALRTARRRTIVFGAGAVGLVLVAVGTVVLVSPGLGGSDVPPLDTPRTRADPVPAGKPLASTDVPEDCGVPAVTRRKLSVTHAILAHRDPDSMQCTWHSASSDHHDRTLDITVGTQPDADIRLPDGLLISGVGHAIRDLADLQARAASSGITYRTVTGLGERAMTYYLPTITDDGGGTVVFQYRNITATVTYSGYGSSGQRRVSTQVPKKVAVDGALRVARKVAGKLGADVSVKPATATPPAGPRALTSLPRPCDLVPTETLHRVAPHASRSPDTELLLNTASGLLYRSTNGTCTWQNSSDVEPPAEPQRALTVSMASLPDRGRPGRGARDATRAYLAMHHSARRTGASGKGRGSAFHALTGPGDQAFSMPFPGNESPDAQARVVFRVRNVLVVVQYSGTGAAEAADRPMPKRRGGDGAYTVATRVAASLPT